MWLREELTTDDDIMNKEFKSKVTVSSVGVNSAGIYKEDILNGADPVLKEGLIPVTIDNEGKVTRADINKKWYNYANQEWANAVILEDDYEDPGAGKEIPEDQIESYFVWIPRYKYKIWDDTNHGGITAVENRTQIIQVIFETKDVKASAGSTTNSWLTHPAFTAFDVNGLWVGKFETGYKDATDLNSSKQNVFNSNEIIIKPNVNSWKGIDVSHAHLNSFNYQRELDSHMMKNTEWGAVAYLQHSNYGSHEKVRINNNSDFLTGYAAVNEPTCSYSYETKECNLSGNTEDITVPYNTIIGNKASTTGNITGIYDMSGGVSEEVMAGIDDGTGKIVSGQNSSKNSGFNGKYSDNKTGETEKTDGENLPDKKYYDVYDISKGYVRILGDATGELGPYDHDNSSGTQRTINSWYKEGTYGINNTNPWRIRGGNINYGYEAGIFAFEAGKGIGRDEGPVQVGYRIVLAPK